MHLLGGRLVKASLILIIQGNQVGHGFALKQDRRYSDLEARNG